jgi:TfoX N-terminal domain
VTHDADLLDRVRAILAERTDVEEKRMVSGRSFVVGGHLAVGVSGDALLVRVGRDEYESVVAEPHVRPFELGGKRPLGYVLVEPAGVTSDRRLRAWVARGIDHVTTLPPPRARTTGRATTTGAPPRR